MRPSAEAWEGGDLLVGVERLDSHLPAWRGPRQEP